MNIPPARQEAIQIAKSKLALHPVYLDTETTGNGPNDEVVEVGVVDDDGNVVFESLVKPIGKISADALNVHGISVEMLVNAPRWMHVWPKLETVLAGKAIGIYNAEFDLRLMQQTHALYKMRWNFPGEAFCIMKLYARFYGEWNSRTMDYRWQSLENAGQQCNISLPNAHRGVADTLLTRAILHYIGQQ